MAVAIDSVDVKVQIREAGDTEWRTLVCEMDSQFQHTNDTTETDTKCKTFIGVKKVKGNYSGNAVWNVSPDSDEVSFMEVLEWQKGRTPLEMLIENEAYTSEEGDSIAEGSVLHIFAPGKFVDTTLTAANGEVGKFSWTYKPTDEPVLDGTSA